MTRAGRAGAGLIILAALLGACAAAPSPITPPAPAAVAVAAPEAARAPVETPDETMRYRPPLLAGQAPWSPPPIVELKLESGVRALLVARHDLPYAALHFELARGERSAHAGTEMVLLRAFVDAPIASVGPPLRDVLRNAGASWSYGGEPDRVRLRISVAASAVEEVVGALVRAVIRFDPTPADIERAQKSITEDGGADDEDDPPRARLLQAIDDQLLPASHRYRAPRVTAEGVRSLKPGEILRWRTRLFAVDRVRVAAAGDVTMAALRRALEAAGSGPRPRPDAAPPAIARGVFLVEDVGAKKVDLALVLPKAAGGRGPDERGAIFDWRLALARSALHRAVAEWIRAEVKTGWSEVGAFSRERREAPFEYVAVRVEPGDAVKVVRGILDAMDRVAGGAIPVELIAERRRAERDYFAAGFADNAAAVGRLSLMLRDGDPPEAQRDGYHAIEAATLAEITAAAKVQLRRSEARLVARGAVAGLEAELGKLGLGKITLVRAPKGAARRGDKP